MHDVAVAPGDHVQAIGYTRGAGALDEMNTGRKALGKIAVVLGEDRAR
jgi:hypothetical protein